MVIMHLSCLPDKGEEEEGFKYYLFYEPSLQVSSGSGTKSMAKVVFTVKDEGSAPLIYTPETVFRKSDNNTINLNTYGEGL